MKMRLRNLRSGTTAIDVSQQSHKGLSFTEVSMDLFNALNDFVRVVENGSFARVAREKSFLRSVVTR